VAEIIAYLQPKLWGSPGPLTPSPAERSLQTRFLVGMAPLAGFMVLALIGGSWFIAGRSARSVLQAQVANTAAVAADNVPYFLETGQNLGFAGGVNRGLETVLPLGAEWVLLVNNDTLVAADFLPALAQAAHSHPEYAILAPLIFYHAAPQRIWFSGQRRLAGTLLTRPLHNRRTDPAQWPDVVPVDFVSGCGMLIQRQVFDEIGRFDPAFFMYGEEVDFCQRAQQTGFRLACVPAARMWHKVSLSADRDRAATRYYRIRNQIRFYRKHAGPAQRIFLGAFTLARAAWLALGDVWRRSPHLLSPLGRGWWDGWFQRQ